jgi:hypothetical protein
MKSRIQNKRESANVVSTLLFWILASGFWILPYVINLRREEVYEYDSGAV